MIRESLRYPKGPHRSGHGVDVRAFDSAKYYCGSLDRTEQLAPGSLQIHSSETLNYERVEKKLRMELFSLWYLNAAGFSHAKEPGQLNNGISSTLVQRLHDGGDLVSNDTRSEGGANLLSVVISYPDPLGLPLDQQPSFEGLRGESR
ncbi:MAG: hypothetical protein AAF989_12710, partial [Planctomycetota bacterium]